VIRWRPYLTSRILDPRKPHQTANLLRIRRESTGYEHKRDKCCDFWGQFVTCLQISTGDKFEWGQIVVKTMVWRLSCSGRERGRMPSITRAYLWMVLRMALIGNDYGRRETTFGQHRDRFNQAEG
jgi:hypothetical protein